MALITIDMTPHTDPFAGLESDIDAVPVTRSTAAPAVTLFTELCNKCGGSGAWNAPSSLGHHRCTKCGGTGKLEFKTSKETRMRRNQASTSAKLRRYQQEQDKGDQRLKAFEEAHPAFAAWWTNTDFSFALSLREAVRKYGSLTERQQAAAEGAIAKRAAAQAEKQERANNAPTVDISAIEKVFAKATGNGLRTPKLRLAGFVFSPAKAISANAGAIYVKHDGVYMGKIAAGKFHRVRECTDYQQAEIIRVASSPEQAAIEYGRMTGACSICNRPLDKKESIERGIGPICASKFF